MDQQRRFPILFKTVQVGEYVPDLLVAEADLERAPMLNHLCITQLRVGLILKFGRPKLEWERVVP